MKTALLIGAGFSYDLGMPISSELTEVFLDIFDLNSTQRLVSILSIQEPFSSDRPINERALTEGFDLLLKYKESKGNNYEELFSQLQLLTENHGKSQSDKDSFHYLYSIFYEMIHTILSIYQTYSYELLYSKSLIWFSKLENLLSNEETWAFSLNHDLFLECLAIDLGIPISYGETASLTYPISNLEMNETITFSTIERKDYSKAAPGFFRVPRSINLIKLHGSLSEYEIDDRGLICNPSLKRITSRALLKDFDNIQRMGYYHENRKVPGGKDRVITEADGTLGIICKAMLTGGKKYSKTAKPKDGEEKLKVFDQVLSEIDKLTIIGYGFGDKHVNFRISNAMARKEDLKLEIIDPIFRPVPEFLEQFDYDFRIMRSACGAAHWMDYCKSQKWDTEQIEGLKENSKLRTIIREKVENTIPFKNRREKK